MLKHGLQKLFEGLSRPRVAFLIALASLALNIIFFEHFYRSELQQHQSDARVAASSELSLLRGRVERELNALLFISNGLSSYLSVYHEQLETDNIYAILSDFYANSKHVRNFGIAVGYRMTYVYPVEGNEKALELYFPDHPVQWSQVQTAINTHSGVLAGPVKLVQGGSGLIYRYPVFVNDEYWGIISTVIDTNSFLKAAFNDIKYGQEDFAIQTYVNGKLGKVIYGNPNLFNQPDSLVVESEVPNGKWRWAIKASISQAQMLQARHTRFMGWGISLLLSAFLYLLLKDRARLNSAAMFDTLTGLANRRLLLERLEHTLQRLQREPDYSCALLFFDLNDFKTINDTYGHGVGDQVLTTVAQRIRTELRQSDTVARLGGDEFVVVIEYEIRTCHIPFVEKRLRNIIAKPMEINKHVFEIQTSIGIAHYRTDGLSPESMLKAADSNMYEDKKIKHNR